MAHVMNRLNILVIGGTGFIGRALYSYLSEKGHFLTITSSKGANQSNHYQLDLGSPDQIALFFKNKQFDIIINCSGYIDHSNSFSYGSPLINVHLQSLYCLIDNIRLTQNSLYRYIHLGSSDEYGSSPAPQTETMREQPFTEYSYAKTAATHYLQAIGRAQGFPAVILRLFLVYGPNLPSNRFLGYLVSELIQDHTVYLSPGHQLRDFLYIDDLARLIGLLTERPVDPGALYNIGSGNPLTILQMATMVHKTIRKGRIDNSTKPYRVNENMALFPDISKIKQDLGWSPQISTHEGIVKLCQTLELTNSNHSYQ